MRVTIITALLVFATGCSKKSDTAPAQKAPAAAPAPAQPAEGNPAQPTPAEAKPAEAKPTEAQPAEIAPVAAYEVPTALPTAMRKATYPRGNKTVAKKLNKAALKARKAELLEEAMTNYKASVQAAPGWVAPRYNLACEYARFGKADKAISELEHILRIGNKDARKYASKTRTDPDFDPIRSDHRLKAIANDFQMDFDVDPAHQLCGDYGKVGTMVNSELGLYKYYDHKDRNPRLLKGGKARGAVYKILDTWCSKGKRHRYKEMGIPFGAPAGRYTLSKDIWVNRGYKCLWGSGSGIEVGAGDSERYKTGLCFVRHNNTWVIGVVGVISGMDDGSGKKVVARARRKAVALYSSN